MKFVITTKGTNSTLEYVSYKCIKKVQNVESQPNTQSCIIKCETTEEL